MKNIPYPNMISQVADQAEQRDMEQFRQEQIALFKQEQAQHKQRDIEASSTEMPHQPAPTISK